MKNSIATIGNRTCAMSQRKAPPRAQQKTLLALILVPCYPKSDRTMINNGITHQSRKYTNIAQETTHHDHTVQKQIQSHTHTSTKISREALKKSTHKFIQNKHPRHLILKPLFSTDTQPMAARGSSAPHDECK
jgi:hypothetical protein